MAALKIPDVPGLVHEAYNAVAAADGCLMVGFGRLGPDQTDALARLGRVAAGSPLGKPVAESLEAIGRNEFQDRHFVALAAARSALLGACHDALRAAAHETLGRKPIAAADPHPPTPAGAEGPLASRQESARNWLMELALAGFNNLESATLDPFRPTLAALQDEPAAVRLAATLTGFLDELAAALPLREDSRVPLWRWADLWSRSLLLAARSPEPAAGAKVSGSFAPLGVDVRHHGFFVRADVYGVLTVDTPRLVRMGVSAYKVDVLVGPETFRPLETKCPALWKALEAGTALDVADCTLLPSGDLLPDGTLAAGKAIDFAALYGTFAVGVAEPPAGLETPAADRHPLHLAEPVWLTGDDLKGMPIATKRVSPTSEITPAVVKGAEAAFGLLRFDAGAWALQPLAVQTGGKKPGFARAGSTIRAGSLAAKGDTLSQLQERAGRLLRPKPGKK